MPRRLNPFVQSVMPPPVGAARARVAGRTFPPDRPLVDLGQAVPSYPPAPALREHLAEVVRRPDSSAYSPVLGLPHVRDAIASSIAATHGSGVTPANVMVTAGCNEAFCLAVGALAGPGDEVVLPQPYYFNHEMWLRAQAIEPILLPVHVDNGMVPDPDEAATLLTDRTRAIVLVTPNNPTGATYPPAVIGAFGALASERGVALIVDETYVNFRPTTEPPHDLVTTSWPEHVLLLFSYSKSLALAGYRVGALVAHPSVLHEAAKLADCVTIGAPRVSQEAAAFGVNQLDDWTRERRDEMRERVEVFTRAWPNAERSGWQLISAGAFFAYVRHPLADAGVSSDEVARRLADDHNLLAIPGTCFGPDGSAELRLAFGNVEHDVAPVAVDRLAELA